MNSLDLINKLYKPYRITKVSSATIIDSTEGKFVIKPKGDNDLKELFLYLKSRGFEAVPKLVDDSRSDVNIFEYIESANYPNEQKGMDLINLVAHLHKSTSFNKEVREDKFKTIYEDIKNNLIYYKNEYEHMISSIEEEIFMSPSSYLFIRNSSKLLAEIKFCETKLDDWYETVKNKRESRVCLIHNDLSLNHYLNGESEALISWEKAKMDSPILDIYKLYLKEWNTLEFSSILKNYLKKNPLDKEELDLLLIMLCMPREIKSSKNELKSCEIIGNSIDYVIKTEELVRPYYTDDDKV